MFLRSTPLMYPSNHKEPNCPHPVGSFRVTLILLAFVFLIAAFATFPWLIYKPLFSQSSLNYVETPCFVKTEHNRKFINARKYEFRYSVDGKEYFSSALGNSPKALKVKSDLLGGIYIDEEKLPTVCYVDPNNPGKAFLFKPYDYTWILFGLWLLGFLWSSIYLFCFFRFMKREAQIDVSNERPPKKEAEDSGDPFFNA